MTIGVTGPPPADNGARRLDRLSERELRVLRLIAEGLSDAAIAGRLSLSAESVESTCSSIFSKLELQPSEHFDRRVMAVLVLLREERGA